MGGLIGIIALVGWIWMIVIAFKKGDPIWGIACIFCTPIIPIVYGVLNFEECKVPLILIIIGLLGGGGGYALT